MLDLSKAMYQKFPLFVLLPLLGINASFGTVQIW